MNPWRTCIVGFGKIAAGYAMDPVMARHYRYTTHVQVLQDHPRFQWTAAVDPLPEARAAARELEAAVETAADAAALEHGRDAEVVILANPPGPGRLLALEAFPHARAVLVEKPLGRTLREAREFLAACARRDIVVQVALWRRADPAFRALASGDLANRIGKLQTGHALYGNGLRNNGVHLIDMIRMLCGEIAQVEAVGAATAPAGLPIAGDLQVDAALTLANGRTVFLSALDFGAYREVGLDLWGETGRLSILQEGLLISHFPTAPNRAMSGEREIASDAPETLPSTVGEAFWHLYDDLAKAIDTGARPCSPGDSAIISESVVDAIAESPAPAPASARLYDAPMTDVLMFIEDPGAVNFMAPVIPALRARGRSVAIRVTGAAAAFIGRDDLADARPPEGDAEAVLAAVKPRIVLTGTSENTQSLGFDLTLAARSRGLPTMAMVDGPSNAAARFQGGADHALAYAPDHILVPDAATAASFVALGHPKANVAVCGHPHYDWVRGQVDTFTREGRQRVRDRLLRDVPADTHILVFAAEVSTGLVPAQYRRSESYTIHGSGENHFRSEIVIEELLDAIALLEPRPYTVLRLHPKNTRQELAQFHGRFDAVSEGGSALDLVFAADAVVGMTSILLAEAAIVGRPVLAILPRLIEYEWLPSAVRGQIPFATTRVQVQEGVAALLSHRVDTDVATIAFEPNAAAHAADFITGLLRT